ncbi:MAG: nucleotidyltransferase domain-containing protein [FCB group bacterium]|nr:nucleotidyltransferase domain-containing protein [FCB group bacterium]MBL7029235.1 nucleotidyltransferase domain-containing protein [Candidatus Neomarinimicrobiota bacterium]MBL7123218.1 nucleotidyltransferase domain-containing protein [Candidatus Neomarinimicrobiota bacterium]
MTKSQSTLLPNRVVDSLRGYEGLSDALHTLTDHFSRVKGIYGILVSGSVATGNVDEYSDLDLLVVVSYEELQNVWQDRYDHESTVGKIFFRIDLVDVYPTSAVAFLEDGRKIHITYKAVTELTVEAEYTSAITLLNNDSRIDDWLLKCRQITISYDFARLAENDRSFWFWLLQGTAKVGRGEYWAAYDTLNTLREICIEAHAALNKKPFQSYRRIEDRWKESDISKLSRTVPKINQGEISKAYSMIISLYSELRKDMVKKLRLSWNIELDNIDVIKKLADQFLNGESGV